MSHCNEPMHSALIIYVYVYVYVYAYAYVYVYVCMYINIYYVYIYIYYVYIYILCIRMYTQGLNKKHVLLRYTWSMLDFIPGRCLTLWRQQLTRGIFVFWQLAAPLGEAFNNPFGCC